MRVSIIGTGYVGLVTGAGLADLGHDVVCVDIDESKVAAVNSATPPIHEEGLAELLERTVATTRTLRATTDLADAVLSSDLTLIAAPTPFGGETIDLRFIRQVAGDVGALLARKDGYHVVVVKSTVVPGTTEQVVVPALEKASGKQAGPDFGVGMNPEFLSEGVALRDFRRPDRIVIGGIDERTLDVMAELYASFDSTPLVRTTPSTAEMIKYASNALLATAISFSNEIARVAEAVGGIDAVEVMRGVHLMRELTIDGRAAPLASFLLPGVGFGGSCFPKDVQALVAHGRQHHVDMDVLAGVLAVNAHQPGHSVDLVEIAAGGLGGRRVAVLGLAFKPGTDDTRESPAYPIVDRLLHAGATVVVHDPIVRADVSGFDGVEQVDDVRAAVRGAHVVVLVTSWPDYAQLGRILADEGVTPVVFDGRRVLDAATIARYTGIGLPVGPV